MKKYRKLIGVAVIAIVVLGILGYAAGNESNGSQAFVGDESTLAQDGTMAAIDRALGRPESVTSKQTAQDEAARSSAAVGPVAPAPGVAGAGTGSKEQPAPAAPDGSALASVNDRKIVQTASMRLQVKEVGGSFEEVGRIANAAGGFVASSSFALQGDQQIATVTIRVPAERYQETLSRVRALGAKVDSEASNASDVTEEYSDLSARLRNLEATEAQLLQLLGRANSVNEILLVQDRLNSVRNEIERVKGRIALLDKLSDLATISVQLRPLAAPAKVDGGGVNIGEEVSEAWDNSLEFLAGIAAGVLSVVVFSWWLIPLAALAALIWQRWLRSRPAPRAASYD